MIPGYDISMESLMEYHTQRFYRNTYGSVFDNPALIKKMKDMGLSQNPKLSELEKHFKMIETLKDEFNEQCDRAGKSNIIICLDNKINEIRKKFETKLHLILRLLPGHVPPLQDDIDIKDEDIKWSPAYISYHCAQEGYDAPISDLGILTLYEIGTVESRALAKITGFLQELSFGAAYAKFMDELRTRRHALTILPEIDYAASDKIHQSVIDALQPLKGNNMSGQQIMLPSEFERLLQYTFHLVEREEKPKNIVSISHTQIPTEFIRKTYHELHRKHCGKVKRMYWIDFLHEVFSQFKSSEKTSTIKNFTRYSKGNYDVTKKELIQNQLSSKSAKSL